MELVKLIGMRVIRYLKKHGCFNDDEESGPEETNPQELMPEMSHDQSWPKKVLHFRQAEMLFTN